MGAALKIQPGSDGQQAQILAVIENKPPVKSKKPILLIIVLSLLGIGGGGYYYWTKTPTYALKQIATSLLKKDSATFHAYVDTDKIVDSGIDDILATAMKKTAKKDDPLSGIGGAIGAGLIQMFKPQIKTLVNQSIDKYFEAASSTQSEAKATNSENMKEFSKIEGLASYGVFKTVDYIKVNGNVSNVGIKIFHKVLNLDLILDLKMENQGQWRVTKVTNLGSIMEQIEASEKIKIDQYNSTIRKQLQTFIQVQETKSGNQQDKWGISKKIVFVASMKNSGTNAIKHFSGQANFVDGKGNVLASFPIESTAILAPGKIENVAWQKQINTFKKEDQTLFDVVSRKAKAVIEFSEVSFSNGKVVKMATSVSEIPSTK